MIHRYEDPEIRELWTPTAIYGRWFEVELSALREHDSRLFALADQIGPPSQRLIAHHENLCGHDVAAFLRAWDETIQKQGVLRHGATLESVDQLRARVHYGLTSSDVTDTALAMGLMYSQGVVNQRAKQLEEELSAFAESLIGRRTIGRTHGQLAAPMDASHRWQVLYEMLCRAHRRAHAALDLVSVGKLSGPMGTQPIEGQGDALLRLGLRPAAPATQLVPRDHLAYAAHCLAELSTVAEAIVTQVWLLAQQEVGELLLQGGAVSTSSAMPHKRNPIACETVRGLARLARADAEALQLGIVQWGEHDMSHSSVERVAVPDLLHLVCTALRKTAALVSGLSVVDLETPDGYRDTNAVLRSAQDEGLAYQDAHEAIRTGRLTSVVRSAAASDEETS